MENASKALIIAGAILLAILLISVGIMVFQMVTEPADAAGEQAASQVVQTFNAPWEGFSARPQSAAQIRSLVNRVNSHNSQNDRQITLNAPSAIPNNRNYTVTFQHTDGFISTINVQ